MQNLGKIFAVSLLSLAIVGCASSGGTTDEAATTDTSVEESQTQAVPDSQGLDVVTEEQAAMAANPLLDQTVVYFGYDRSEIRPEFKDILNAHAQYLVANPQARVSLEGHCDERGTVEYNLALGERRANTVKRYLVVQGVNPNQLESVSFGEERPAVVGSDDSAWSKNRRTEINYQAR
ncbi:peptidoglycan-associated lipoprotein Pal [Bermanella sp. WJH001]|uniref:peptidoglycan-associated lipoprotein Pal n=1 Tax=Bermanella sp. WJH001 TaxID=3048005 RepID=UPI0024BEF28A|nr:peptidoglycan-associated lipoprotein Pal [Bermanella sp. WJH001]MDJ1537703.1 peptidoglycan-associated lipoprotein Pal [Bermanella sp. WJH001]